MTTSATRVWVKESAIEAVRNPRPSFKQKLATRQSATTTSQLASQFSKQASFASGISSVNSSSSSKQDDGSEIGSSVSNSQQGSRSSSWGWKRGNLVDSSKGNITITLDVGSPETSTEPLVLAASAMSVGDVVMANEYEISSDGKSICPDDLISLTHLHEPSVVECLEQRYEDNHIYTATGPVLLALNPFQNIRGLYGESTMKQYWEKAESNSAETLPPHVYAIADNAFRSMMRKLDETLGDEFPVGCDQSILVSGESGSGKTVTTKFVMKYLAALSQRAGSKPQEKRAYEKVADTRSLKPAQSRESAESEGSDQGLLNVTNLNGSGAENSIEGQVLQSNPILESFANARTFRNDNSSRFGKFIELQFTRMGRLVGAQIETYLLEKVRLVNPSAGERNYHIFYEMLSGSMNTQELRSYFIAPTATPEDFKLTATGTYGRRDGVSDKETFGATRAAMNTMGFPKEEQGDIFATVAAILHASNLTFLDYDLESALDNENVHLQPVCHLLGVTPEDLNRALCHVTISAGNEAQVQQNLPVDKAVKGLEALLKATYGTLFTYMVSRINDSISYQRGYDSEDDASIYDPDLDPAAVIGVLDIFGFESFKTNSFEQLCINYCNEALQQQFNAFVLKNEQAEYEREGIDWSFIDFPENQDVLDLIDKRGSGILGILDDQCKAPGTTDRSFALDVTNKCKNHQRFSADSKQIARLQFSVHHYAGAVEYSTQGFIVKNRDELPKEATELLQNSFNPFIRHLADVIEFTRTQKSASKGNSANEFRRQESSMARETVGGEFRRQLRHLREKIDHMTPHYVRCLKPNDELVQDHFDRAAIAEQLRCGGILEAVRVARAGFSNHYSHSDFVRRYKSLVWKEMRSSTRSRKSTLADPSKECMEVIKLLCEKIQEENDNNNENACKGNSDRVIAPSAQAKKYANTSTMPAPSWSKKAPLPPAEPNTRSLKRGGGMSSELVKLGIQFGKTKVFLRHTAFEKVERIRTHEHSRAAVKLNSVFRMYLSRLAFVHVRNVIRSDMHDLIAFENGDEDELGHDGMERFKQLRHSFSAEGPSLVDLWAQQVRGSIHNPQLRHELGKQDSVQPFEWMLLDGLWVKNHDVEDEEGELFEEEEDSSSC
jgi:myosin-5